MRNRGSIPTFRVLALFWLVVMTTPTDLYAQVCIGNPAGQGQFSLAAGVKLAEGSTGYGVGLQANLEGPIGLGANFGITDVDNLDSNITQFGAGLSFDLPVEGFALCPTAGATYRMWRDNFGGVTLEASALLFPVGFSVGTRLGPSDGVGILPNAEAGFYYSRLKATISEAGRSYSESETATEFFVGGGGTLDFGQIFLSAGVLKTTLDGSDATLSIALGFRF